MERTSLKIDLVKDAIERGISYTEYRNLISELLLKGQSTGHEQTEDLVHYSTLNNQRMKRLDKTIKLSEDDKERILANNKTLTFLVITEGWCGDASQVIPVVNKIVESNPNFDMKIVLRDDNIQLMDAFLTNGNRAIAKFIIYDREQDSIFNTYGPRPSIATQMVTDYKKNHGSLDAEFKEHLQVWYNKDRGQNVIKDLLSLIA